MESEFPDFQNDEFLSQCLVGTYTSHTTQNSVELQIVNDLKAEYELCFKSGYVRTGFDGERKLRYVEDCLNNPCVSLKITPIIQGKIRVDWLTIPDRTGQRYIMPYRFLANNTSLEIPDCNPIMYDINTDMNGFMRLYLVLLKGKEKELSQSQPLVLFQPINDALNNSNIPCHRPMSLKQLIRKFQLNKSQLAFTLCTTTDGISFVPQWYTTVFSTVMEVADNIWKDEIASVRHHHVLSSNTNMDDNYEQDLSIIQDAMQQSKRQKINDTRVEGTTELSMINASFVFLPVELVHHIFDYCDVKAIFSVRCVCRQMYDCVNSYDRLKLTFKSTSLSTAELAFRYIRPERVISLTFFDIDNERNNPFRPLYSFFNNLQFTRLHSLSIDEVSETSRTYSQNHSKYRHSSSISIKKNRQGYQQKWNLIFSTFSQYNLRKLCVNPTRLMIKYMPCPKQWKLEYLTINRCTYEEFLFILQQLPHLRTFSMYNCSIDDNDTLALSSSNNISTAALESLTIRHCSLSPNHLKLLLSLTPSLRHLKLASYRIKFDSFFDNIYWENLVSIQLSKLDQFEFIFFYTFKDNDNSINVNTLVASFRSLLLFHDKRSFVAGAYVFRENRIWLYTVPNNFACVKNLVRIETSSMDNENYFLTQKPLYETPDILSDKTFTTLDLHPIQTNSQIMQNLADMLHNNTILVELNLGGSEIRNHGAKYLAQALENNKILKILWLWQNQIDHEGAQYLADALCKNTTLKELYLGYNLIGDQGAQYFAHALQNNTTLTTLDLHSNRIERKGIQDLASLLVNNKTLITLGLGYNKIGDEEVQYLINTLTNNTTLQHLYLGENNISSEIWNQFHKKDN